MEVSNSGSVRKRQCLSTRPESCTVSLHSSVQLTDLCNYLPTHLFTPPSLDTPTVETNIGFTFGVRVSSSPPTTQVAS